MRSGQNDAKVQGLVGNHAYSVLRAVECHGKKFVIVRNPWGNSEWTGRWADGSKEWTQEWLNYLPEIGQFVMECRFLLLFSSPESLIRCHSRFGLAGMFSRTILFDQSWRMSSTGFRLQPILFLPPGRTATYHVGSLLGLRY